MFRWQNSQDLVKDGTCGEQAGGFKSDAQIWGLGPEWMVVPTTELGSTGVTVVLGREGWGEEMMGAHRAMRVWVVV